MRTVGPEVTGQLAGDIQEQRVSARELFFDLVFAFVLTQVTAYLADGLGRDGLLRGPVSMAGT